MIEHQKIEQQANRPERQSHDTVPKQFFTVMTGVLMRNLNVSLKRLGIFKARSYRKRLS